MNAVSRSTSSARNTPISICPSSMGSRRARATRWMLKRAGLAARLIVAIRQKPKIADRLSQVDVSGPARCDRTPERRLDAAARRRFALSRTARVVFVAVVGAAMSAFEHGLRRPAFRRRVCVKPAGKTEKISAPVSASRRSAASPTRRGDRTRDRRHSGAQRTVSGWPRRGHVEGDGCRRRDDPRTAWTSSAWASPKSRGIRRGVVVNLETAVDSIKKAIDEAELMAGVRSMTCTSVCRGRTSRASTAAA